MRLAIGGVLFARCLATWPAKPFVLIALCLVESVSAILLVAGVVTPIWGAGAAIVELWRAYSNPADVVTHLLLATLGAALALLGPGAFSVDARVFGWQRISLPSKGSKDDSN
jgi:putative oxidoreductase